MQFYYLPQSRQHKQSVDKLFCKKMLLQLALVLLAIMVLVLKLKKRPFDMLYQKIPFSLQPLPVIGHLHLMICNDEERMKIIQQVGRDAMSSGLAGFWFPHKLYIIIADTDIAEIVLKACLEKDDIMNCLHLVTGDGSIFAPVKVWRPRRRLMAPTYNVKNLNRFSEMFSKKSCVLVKKLQSAVGKGPISMWKLYSLYSMDAICGSLGIDIDAQDNADHPILEGLEIVFQLATDRLFKPWLYSDFIYKLTPMYHAALKYKPYAFEFFYKLIREKRENKLHNKDLEKESKRNYCAKSFVDLMIASPMNVDDETIREESFVLFGAASDTSAVALGYASLLLAKYPEVQEKVYEELEQTIGDFDRAILVDDLPHLKYLDAVIKETIRLYPPVPIIARKIDKDIELPSGVTLLAGCGGIIHIWAINRNPKYWGDDADQFRPERFLDSAPKNPAAFMSFSHGPRNCLGFQYAIMSVKTVLASVLRKYQFLPASPDEPKHEPLRVKFGIMMRHLDNYRVKIEART